METLIKQALKKVGLAEGLWTQISVATESQIESAVMKLAKTERESNVRKILKEAGLEGDLDKITQSVSDQRVSEALKTHDEKTQAERDAEAEAKRIADEATAKTEAENKRKADELAGLEGDKKTIAELKDLLKTQADTHNAELAKVTELITGVQSGLNASARDVTVASKIKDAGLSPEWASFVTEIEPEKISQQIIGLKDNYTAQRQIENDKRIADGKPPITSTSDEPFSDQLVAEHAQSRPSGVVSETAGLASKQVLAK